MASNNNSPPFLSRQYRLTIQRDGELPYVTAKLTQQEAQTIRTIIMTSDERLRYTTRPLDKTTSFQLVDEHGENVYREYYNKKFGIMIRKEVRQPLKVNLNIWNKYARYCYSMGYTLCSPLREFCLAFNKFQNQYPTQETLRWFVETLANLTPTTPIRFQTDNQQISLINDKQIIIYPKIRKDPSKRLSEYGT